MIKVSAINIKRLRKNQFKNELPELFELKKTIENNKWHKNDSVFNHTVTVLEELKKLLKNIKNKLNSYLNEKINAHTRRELLFLGALFHDIAKNDTLEKKGDYTSCPGHEEVGSRKIESILDRFDLSKKEKTIVVQIVRVHGKLHIILEPQNNSFKEQYEGFKSEYKDIFMESVLLAMADTLGSQLKDKEPEEFKFRIRFYKEIIENY
jgi:hypothetical protein